MIVSSQRSVNVAEQGNYCTSWGGSRIGAWKVSREIIEDYPIIGIGIDDNM